MSYVQLLYHIIIRTKASKPVLSLEHSDELYRYIWGIIKNKNSVLYRIKGMKKHISFKKNKSPLLTQGTKMVKRIFYEVPDGIEPPSKVLQTSA